MQNKLIQTNFVYIADWFNGRGPSKHSGSRLGRKASSAATIRRFLYRNAKDNACKFKLISLEIQSSHESPWICNP